MTSLLLLRITQFYGEKGILGGVAEFGMERLADVNTLFLRVERVYG